MTISEIIQKHLQDINSSVSLGLTYNGTLPTGTAFAHKDRRTISVHIYKQYWGITFLEKEFCYARFLSLESLEIAQLIDLWLGHNLPVNTVKDKYSKLEIFESFVSDKAAKNSDVTKAWNNLKNFFFSQEYAREDSRFDINTEILKQAKNDLILCQLYPYSSLGRICFSNKKNGCSCYLCIAANSRENTNEKYVVDLPHQQSYLDNLDTCFELIKQNLHCLEQQTIQ